MTIDSTSGYGTSGVAGAFKDTMGAQLMTKTLDKLNTKPGAEMPNPDYQFQKDVLSAGYIPKTGSNTDIEV